MRKLSKNSGLQASLNANRFARVQLESHPLTRHLAERVHGNITKIKNAEGVYQDAKIKRMVLTASIQYQSKLIYAGIMKIGRGLLYQLNGNTKDPLFTKLFPKSPSSMLHQKTLQDQRRVYRQMIETVQNRDAYEAYRTHLPEIIEAETALTNACSEMDSAVNAEKRALNERNLVLQEANDAYNFLEHELALIFPNQSKFIETFFYASSSKRSETNDALAKLRAERAAFEAEKAAFAAEKAAFEAAKKGSSSAGKPSNPTVTADLDPDDSADFNFEDVPKNEDLDDDA